jgi:hypothetical protein
MSTPHPPRDFGVVFDIDGVLLRGDDLIPGSREAVLKVSVRWSMRKEYEFGSQFGSIDG